MGRVLKRIGVGVVLLVFVAGFAALLGFKFMQGKIAANMQPPHLELRPEASSDLVYRTLDGEQRHLISTKGKVVFLDLWGTWCVQCVAEMPTVQKLYEHYKNDPQVTFLIVSRLDSPYSVRSYARRNHLSLPFYVMEDEDIPPSMQLNRYPSTFIFAKDGELVSKHVGAANWSAPSVILLMDQLKAQR
jgi:thiol-disulfide isomerase/thioredoxin